MNLFSDWTLVLKITTGLVQYDSKANLFFDPIMCYIKHVLLASINNHSGAKISKDELSFLFPLIPSS